jgi:predicted amidohydrolase
LVVEQERLVGLRFQETRIEDGRAVPVEGAVEDVRAPQVISSIGSVPEPIKGIAQEGMLYRFSDESLGRVEGYEAVFGIGNVVTGKGNILASRRHSIEISTQLIERFLGLGDEGHAGEEDLLQERNAALDDVAARVADFVDHRPGLSVEQVEALLQRVRARQKAVGYPGTYQEWIESVAPYAEAKA